MNELLCVTFWDISLANLPDGRFVRRSIATDEARERAANARAANSLLAAAAPDLLAPYHNREKAQFEALCEALGPLGIEMSLPDFFSEGEDGFCSIRPLDLFVVRPGGALLVVTCDYALAPGSSALTLAIAPTSIRFHLFEAEV
jgi:hypothetical protein